jgi:uncharacterized protein
VVTPPVILVPPSERKTPGGGSSRRAGAFNATLSDARLVVLDALAATVESASPESLERLFNARGNLADHAVAAVNDLVAGSSPLLPAWQRYSGVVWTALEPVSLSPAQRRRLVVPSGLYGLSGAEDLVGDYRLKMSASLARIGPVANFWRPRITTALAAHARGALIVDLLPKEHQRALDFDALRSTGPVVSVPFVTGSGDRAVGHAAKAAKGQLARALVVEGIDALAGFRWEGWQARERHGRVVVVSPKG